MEEGGEAGAVAVFGQAEKDKYKEMINPILILLSVLPLSLYLIVI